MRYSHNKEQSAEILRLVLPRMARQEAAFHPLSYTLWYEHMAGVNPALSDVLDGQNVALTEADVHRLYSCHITARNAELAEAVQLELKGVLSETTSNISSAASTSAELEAELQTRSSRLEQPLTIAEIQAVVRDLASVAKRMRVSASQLSEVLTDRARTIDEIGERLGQVQSEALLDPLTGLKNRRGFERALAQLGVHQRGLHGAALLLADIDHFKVINDTHGHLMGDKVLSAVAHVLRSNIKGRDIAVRMGGEEFAVLLPDTPLPGAIALAERIRGVVAQGRIQRKDGAEVTGHITISFGVATGAEGEPIESLIERADSALYASKRAGRNRVTVAPARDLQARAGVVRRARGVSLDSTRPVSWRATPLPAKHRSPSRPGATTACREAPPPLYSADYNDWSGVALCVPSLRLPQRRRA
ncbi:MAG: diguanylate cyclase [Gammaproteobacteria bacterium]